MSAACNGPFGGTCDEFGTDADAAGFVLAGGRSSRMRTDKALVRFNGEPLLACAIGILRAAGVTVSLAGGPASLETFAPLIEDRRSGFGPLSGICAALASTAKHWSVFIPVDQPLLPVALVTYLLWRARLTEAAVTLTSVNGFVSTFPVVLNRAVFPALERELEQGRLGCWDAFGRAATASGSKVEIVPVEMLVQAGLVFHPEALPAVHWFMNVNTAEDLQRAQDTLKARNPVS